MHLHESGRGSVWLVVVIILALLVIVGGLLFYDGSGASGPQDEPLVTLPFDEVTLPLAAVGDAAVTGSARIVRAGSGGTDVYVSLSGAEAGVSYPAELHSGSCAAVGAALYPLADVAAADVPGTSESTDDTSDESTADEEALADETGGVIAESHTTLDAPLEDLIGQLPLALTVRASADDLDTDIACGDVEDPRSLAAEDALRASPKVSAAVWEAIDAGEPSDVVVLAAQGALDTVLGLLNVGEFALSEDEGGGDNGDEIFGAIVKESAIKKLIESPDVISVATPEEMGQSGDGADE